MPRRPRSQSGQSWTLATLRQIARRSNSRDISDVRRDATSLAESGGSPPRTNPLRQTNANTERLVLTDIGSCLRTGWNRSNRSTLAMRSKDAMTASTLPTIGAVSGVSSGRSRFFFEERRRGRGSGGVIPVRKQGAGFPVAGRCNDHRLRTRRKPTGSSWLPCCQRDAPGPCLQSGLTRGKAKGPSKQLAPTRLLSATPSAA